MTSPEVPSRRFDQPLRSNDRDELPVYWHTAEMFHADRVAYQPDPPTDDADTLMSVTIVRPPESSLLRERFSQTPLAPKQLIDRGIPYPDLIANVLEKRVVESALRAGLDEDSVFTQAILHEVYLEHQRRITGNTMAIQGLYKQVHGETLSPEEARLTWRARTGDASLAETGELLLRFPGMNSIEAAKYTKPFEWEAVQRIDREHIPHAINDLKWRTQKNNNAQVTWFPESDSERRNPHPIPILDAETNEEYRVRQSIIIGYKDNVAALEDSDMRLLLVRKRTMVLFPPDFAFPQGVQPMITNELLEGKLVNAQPIAISYYWRVAHKKSV